MEKTPGTRRILIEQDERGRHRWFLRSGNGKRIATGNWIRGLDRAINSANGFRRLLKTPLAVSRRTAR